MYDKLIFEPEKSYKRTKDVNEALEIASTLTVHPYETSIGELTVNEDGTLQNGELKKTTRSGFESFCKILGIPRPFARQIPLDLLFTNIKRLQKEKASNRVVLLERPEGGVANIVKAPYTESSYLDFLSHFSDKPDIKYLEVGEGLASICLSFSETKFNGVGDDPLFIGTFVHNSILQNKSLHMFSGIYRTVCENSFVMPYLGMQRADYKLPPDSRLLKFSESVRCFDEEVLNRVQLGFERLEYRKLFEFEAAKIWNKLKSTVGEIDADILMKYNSEERALLLDRVKTWRRENKRAKLLGEAVSEPLVSSILAYDLVNDVTSHSQAHYFGEDRVAAERLAGGILESALLN